MPIVASIGGNTGNQTAVLVIRGLALAQLDGRNLQFLLRKELSIGLVQRETPRLCRGGIRSLTIPEVPK